MKKSTSLVQIIIFCGFIATFCLLFFIMPNKDFSEMENRSLAQAPKFSLESLFADEYTKKFETYTTDQFPFRDAWTTIKARSELASGKKENKGVYLCKNDTLIESYETPDSEQTDLNISAVNALAEKTSVPVYFALIPGLAEVRSDLIPKNAPMDSQLDYINDCYAMSAVQNIDMYSALKPHEDEYIYYRTDHHWTSLGAYYGYTAIMDAMGRESFPLSSYERKTVSEDFYGTIYSKSGMSWVAPDNIETFAQQNETVTVTNYVQTDPQVTALYDEAFLDKKDKYSMFMGGISPLITVSGGNSEGTSLLIIRDSYTDSIIPFIQSEFSEIHIMDLRYYRVRLTDHTVADYVDQNEIDEVLVMYSVANFGVDTNASIMGE